MEDIDGGLRPALDGQSLDEVKAFKSGDPGNVILINVLSWELTVGQWFHYKSVHGLETLMNQFLSNSMISR